MRDRPIPRGRRISPAYELPDSELQCRRPLRGCPRTRLMSPPFSASMNCNRALRISHARVRPLTRKVPEGRPCPSKPESLEAACATTEGWTTPSSPTVETNNLCRKRASGLRAPDARAAARRAGPQQRRRELPGLYTPHLRDRWGFPWVDTALIHLIRCPKAENLPRCFIEKSHRLLDLLCFHCPEIGAPGNSPFPVGRAEN